MATLQQLRAMFGGESDAETITRAAGQLGMSPFDIADEVGVSTGRRRSAFTAGVSSGVDDLQGLGYSAVAAAADTISATRVRDWANAQAARNQSESQLSGRPDLEQVEDVWNKPGQWGPYAAYQVGKQVPNIAGAIGAGALMPEVAVPAALSRGAAVLPRMFGGGGMASRVAAAAEAGGSEFAARRAALEAGQTFGRQVTGGAAFNYGQGVGSLYQEAQEGGDPNAGVKSLAGGVPYALTETLPEAMLVGRIGHGSGFSGNILKRAGKSAGVQAVAGASSELAQNEMEMAYNGHVTPEQAFSKRLNAGVAGALVEGIVGSAGGLRRNNVAARTVDDGPTDMTQRGGQPLALPWNARKSDLGTMVTYPDGSTALASEAFDRQYQDPDAVRFGLTPQDQYPQGTPFVPGQFDTGNMVFREGPLGDAHAPVAPANIDTSGIQLDLTEPGPRPDFSLVQPAQPFGPEQPGAVAPGADPTMPATPVGAQRGVPGQLPFSPNTNSPKGQILQGLVESLASEGHMDMGTHSQASTLIAQGKFAAAKKIVDLAVKEKNAADSMLTQAAKIKEKEDGPVSRATGSGPERAPAGVGVQPSGSGRAVDAVPDGGGEATTGAPATPDAQAGVPVPPSERHGPLAAVTSQALVETADSAKDPTEYDTALDELYARWRDEGDAEAERYFEDNADVPGFSADLARVRERAGEAPVIPAKPKAKKFGSEGKRGLKLGPVKTGVLADDAKETDSLLRGLVSPRLNSKADAMVAPEHQLSDDQFDGMRESIEAAVPNAPRIHVADDPSDIPGIEAPPAGVHPMGLLAKGKMFLFRNAIDSELSALQTAFHELFHYGLHKVLPADQYYRVMAKLEAADGQVRAYAERWRQSEEGVARRPDMSPQLWNALAVEEALADISEEIHTGDKLGSKVRPGTIRRIISWLADVAQTVGMPKLAQYIRRLTLTDAQKFVTDTLAAASQDVAPAKGSIADLQAHDAKPTVEPVKLKARKSPVADSFARVPYANTTLGQKIQDALFNLAESPWALKWTTNDQIAEGYKDLKPVQDINRATQRMASVANRYFEVAAQTAKKWRALADDVQLSMQKIMLRSTMAQAHVSIKDEAGKYLSAEAAWSHEQNKHLDRTDAGVRATFDSLYADFHKLPAAAKVVYDTVRDDLARQHDDTLKALRKSASDQYAGQLSRALTDEELRTLAESDKPMREAFAEVLGQGGAKSEIRALAGLYQALRDIRENFGTMQGPYFPLVRFGDHVVVMKGKPLTDLELRATTLRTQLQEALDENPTEEQTEAHEAKVEDLRTRYSAANKAVEAAKQSDKNYVVEFHETPAQAERSVQALRAKNPDADVYRSIREQYYRGLDGASGSFVRDLQDTVAAALDAGDGVTAEAKSSVLQSVKDLYMRRQPERSALRAELRRMNIEGVQAGQMLRGYAQAARNGAWRISRLTHAGDVTSGLQALSEDRRNPDAKHVLNELKARFVGDLVPPTNNKLLQALSSGTYFMHLGFNISYFVTNATQSWVTSMPVMAGRHGIVNSANSLTAASKDVIRLLSKATAQSVRQDGKLVGLQLRLTDEQIASLARDEGERAMLKQLTDDGVVDITIKHDLGAISDGSSDSLPGKVLELSSALANYPELYNRLATSLAAYRMEVARRGEGPESKEQVQERAERYAEYIINRTHFNYSPENAPRMMRGQLGRLVFQFKRYQQGMIYLFAKLVKDSTAGDKDSQRALAYLLGTTVATSGVVGLPIAAPIALAAKILAAAYPDDDEPEWLQEWYGGMKDAVGEAGAQAFAKGLPTLIGLDLSKKLGQGDLVNPMAFARTDGKKVFSRDYMTAAGFGLLGPGAALLANDAEAVGAAKAGDFLNAAKYASPTFVAQALEAFRRADRGVVSTKGDTIMEPEEFNALATAAKAMGFEGVKVSDMYDQRAGYLDAVHNRTEARQALLRQYYEAIKGGDSDGVAAAREAINDFNSRQHADRIKGQDLASSIKTHAQRARETVGGLRVGKRDRDTYREFTGQ